MDGNTKIKDRLQMARQDDLEMAKAVLDKCIKRVSGLAGDAFAEAITCCGELELDARDQLQDVAGLLRQAEGLLIQARAAAGRIDSGGIVRSGGT